MKDEGQLGSCRVASPVQVQLLEGKHSASATSSLGFFLFNLLIYFLGPRLLNSRAVYRCARKKGGFVRARTQAKTLK